MLGHRSGDPEKEPAALPSGGQGQQAIRWRAARAAEAANGCQAPQLLAQFDECELAQPVNMPRIKLALGAKADASQRVLFVWKLAKPDTLRPNHEHALQL